MEASRIGTNADDESLSFEQPMSEMNNTQDGGDLSLMGGDTNRSRQSNMSSISTKSFRDTDVG